MVPLVGNLCTNLIANGSIGKEIGANGKNGNTIGANGTNVTNQWYHWKNPEHTLLWQCRGNNWGSLYIGKEDSEMKTQQIVRKNFGCFTKEPSPRPGLPVGIG